MHTQHTGLAAVVVLAAVSAGAAEEWTAQIERGGKPAYAWVPEGCKLVRGVFITQQTMFEARITKNEEVRAACAEKGLAIIFAQCGIGLTFINGPGGENMLAILAEMAKATKHPELEFAPLITAGHSTAGIYCRNVAYWKPERVAGVVHIMSGNLQTQIEDPKRTLAGVPILFINGEWEQYGPEGGDLPGNLRAEYTVRDNPNGQKGRDGKTLREGQTQWTMVRQQILARRGKNPDNVMGLVVSRNHNHTTWEPAMNGLVAQFIRSAADLRIPKGDPDGKSVVKCLPVKAAQGWLLDADIKAPKFQPAPFAEYQGEKRFALWYPDKAMARAVWEYNQKGWPDPDPTANWPVAKRFTPPAALQDLVDSPPAPKLTWAGGDGVWGGNQPAWRDEAGKTVPWNPDAEAVFAGAGGVVRTEPGVSCSGLTVGKGYTLALGANTLESRVNLVFEPGSTLEVLVNADEANGRWGARLSCAGTANIAGTLVLKGANLKAGTYNLIKGSGKTNGSFEKVVPPEGWTTTSTGAAISLAPAGPATK